LYFSKGVWLSDEDTQGEVVLRCRVESKMKKGGVEDGEVR
jgi:hypothetical protein